MKVRIKVTNSIIGVKVEKINLETRVIIGIKKDLNSLKIKLL